ncbi:MAG: efflux RND transporter permease subunit [Pirellulales bacterium]
MLSWLVPICVLIIVLAIWLTFRDVMDSAIILLTLPGALVGAAIAQWLLGLPISLSVIVGYISCLGMAAATGMVMLTYLRSSIEQSGGLGRINSDIELKIAVVRGATHRLRPKLLTEVTMIASLVPIMWSTGIGSDVIRPMAAPVLGGILIADEVIDLVVPALFYKVRQWRWRQMQARKSQEGTLG